MTKIILNSKLIKTRKQYDIKSASNTEKLRDIMKKLLIQEQEPTSSLTPPKPTGGSIFDKRAWNPDSEKKKKAKTFKL